MRANTRTICCLFLGVAVLFCASNAGAYRPFDGTDADVADTGDFELEFGPVHYYRQGDRDYFTAPATVLNLGIFPRWEFVTDLNTTFPLHPEDGEASAQLVGTDVLLKALVRRGALQGEAGPSLAVEFGPLLPEVNGDAGFGASLNIILSEQWSWFAVHLNNEPSLSRGDLRLSWFTSLIAEGRFDGPVRPALELSWEREFVTKDSTYSALAGFIWSVHKSLDLDAAGRVASVDKELAFEARLGLTWTLAVWTPSDE